MWLPVSASARAMWGVRTPAASSEGSCGVDAGRWRATSKSSASYRFSESSLDLLECFGRCVSARETVEGAKGAEPQRLRSPCRSVDGGCKDGKGRGQDAQRWRVA